MSAMTTTSNILNTHIDRLTLSEALEQIKQNIINNQKKYISLLDAAMVVNMQKQPMRDIVNSADIILAVGYYVVLASRILGHPLPGQVCGADLTYGSLKLAQQNQFKIFFLGAHKEILEKVVENVSKEYGSEIVAGSHDGYYTEADEDRIVQEINDSKANILLLGISSPKREIFIGKYKNKLNAQVIINVGGMFDIIGGKTTRAPQWVINLKMEWLYRFILEPTRLWKKVFIMYPIFIYLVLKERIFGHC